MQPQPFSVRPRTRHHYVERISSTVKLQDETPAEVDEKGLQLAAPKQPQEAAVEKACDTYSGYHSNRETEADSSLNTRGSGDGESSGRRIRSTSAPPPHTRATQGMFGPSAVRVSRLNMLPPLYSGTADHKRQTSRYQRLEGRGLSGSASASNCRSRRVIQYRILCWPRLSKCVNTATMLSCPLRVG